MPPSPARIDAIDALIAELRDGAMFGGRLHHLELKYSTANEMPFARMKVRLKREIVTLGDPQVDPLRAVGTYVDAADWNALIGRPDVLVIDTRNAFEVALGTFDGAVDPKLASFGEFKDFAAGTGSCQAHDDRDVLHRRHSLRERRVRYLLARGFTDVYHLKGGILSYLEHVPVAGQQVGAVNVLYLMTALRSRHGLQETRRRELFLEGAPDE